VEHDRCSLAAERRFSVVRRLVAAALHAAVELSVVRLTAAASSVEGVLQFQVVLTAQVDRCVVQLVTAALDVRSFLVYALVAANVLVRVVHRYTVAALPACGLANLYLIIAAEHVVGVEAVLVAALSVQTGHVVHHTVTAYRLVRHGLLRGAKLR
jgi:hypothetical protein